MKLGNHHIGPKHPCFIIAEMSANHGHDFDRAMAMLAAMKDAGADAVKLQTYTPDTMTLPVENKWFLVGKGTLWEGETLYSLYGKAYTPWEWHAPLKAEAERLGLYFFSTPFDRTSLDFLEDLGVTAYKIASFENNDLGLLKAVAATGKPVIMSTGMATFEQIEESVMALRDAGCRDLALLKCTSAYPAPPREINLRTIPDLAEQFNLSAGLSDHTMGSAVAIAAVSLGACIIEKHFTLSRDLEGADSAFSMEPHEFREMVDGIRLTEQALGSVQYQITETEEASKVFKRSLFVTRAIKQGETFTEENLRSIRPGYGLAPKHLLDILGTPAACTMEAGTPLAWEHTTLSPR